ncbi:hypothetical protein A6769_39495 [Nostoc punctiforme NIES-2108]|uniref:Uncharacterized protein n=1 Tax=Nostoc punctiforme NIES-2108 TaxID=1356359 RepID=A0A367RWA3_NOSPU|nr:hypothetical protein A6769_39495 [Nostoc punctiforme NIES-2108]
MPAAASYETLRERLRVLILAYSSTNTKRQGNPCLFAFSELAVVKKNTRSHNQASAGERQVNCKLGGV